MKNVFFVMLFWTCTTALFAQVRKPDFLYKKDKTTVEAIIVEIDDEVVKYRKYSSPQGAVVTMKRSDILKIVYSNGETEMISGKVEKAGKAKEPFQKEMAKKEAEPEKAAKKEKSESAQKASRVPASDGGGGMKFAVGLRGGLNLNTFSNLMLDPEATQQLKIGFHGGVIMELSGKTFAVQPEILFSQLGSKITFPASTTGEAGSLSSTINTITVPILLKGKFGGGNMKFFVNAGPYGSYAFNASAIGIEGGVTVIDFKDKDLYNGSEGRIGYGVIGGAGVELGLGAAKLLIEGRYMMGLGDNAKKVAGSTSSDNSFPRSIMASVGILFPLGKK